MKKTFDWLRNQSVNGRSSGGGWEKEEPSRMLVSSCNWCTVRGAQPKGMLETLCLHQFSISSTSAQSSV